MDDSIDLIDSFSGVATSRDGDEDTMKLPRGCLTINTLRDTIISPCTELRFSTPHK